MTIKTPLEIHVRHKLPPGNQRLMDHLGVRVVIDVEAEPCMQFLQAGHGHPWRIGGTCAECLRVAERTT
jgi:hypothetical protein